MYERMIALLTRDHLRDHLGALLAAYEDEKPLRMPMPKTVEISSLIGGVATKIGRETLPAVAVDVVGKAVSDVGGDFWTYSYTGELTWLVSAMDADAAERLSKGYGSVLEEYVGLHGMSPFANDFDATSLPFAFHGFGWVTKEFMGAGQLEVNEKGRATRIWIDGGHLSLTWITAENGPGQHE